MPLSRFMSDTKNRRTYGPLSPIHLRILQTKLDQVRSKYQIFTDQDLLSKAQTREKNSVEASPHLHNTSPVNLKEYLYIDIPTEDILVVRNILVKLGFEQTPDLITEKSLEHEEFVCPQCDFIQNQPGYCPRHHLLLLSYYDIRRKQIQFKNYLIRFFAFVFIGFIVMTIYFSLKHH
jgi:hypothetical protein